MSPAPTLHYVKPERPPTTTRFRSPTFASRARARGSGRGGRAGETFALERDRLPRARTECEIFLDDVTVSRRHAVVTRGADGFTLHDEGSLNGTYVNRRRVESAKLEDGDEVQIGKYKLTFLES